jgi:hypothetical protein
MVKGPTIFEDNGIYEYDNWEAEGNIKTMWIK